MCGRYLLTSPGDILAQAFGVMIPEVSWTARYNIAPGTQVPAVWQSPSSGRSVDSMLWGLLPRWRPTEDSSARLINARSETVAEKPSFRAAFREHRCLFPADGFYEWQKAAGAKVPQLMRRPDRQPFAMAGIFESRVSPAGEVMMSGAILTTRANDALQEIHARMPVVLEPEIWEEWLDPESSVETLAQRCGPVSDDYFEITAVSDRVNQTRNDDVLCLEPAGSLRGSASGTQGGLF